MPMYFPNLLAAEMASPTTSLMAGSRSSKRLATRPESRIQAEGELGQIVGSNRETVEHLEEILGQQGA